MQFGKLFLPAAIIFAILPACAKADYQDQRVNFFVEKEFSASSTSHVSASLKKIGANAYFYVDDKWWNDLAPAKKEEAFSDLNDLAGEFDSKIYKLLTAQFGSEWKPGIDKDNKITVLFSPLGNSYKGYFRTNDEYEKIQVPDSNQREMVYLNADYLASPLASGLLAHEFTHLIQYNQKDRAYGVSDDVWLNEARAEFAVTLLGYNNDYSQSYLRSRVGEFLDYPFDSLTEWRGQSYDYGVLSLFTHYLVEQYGIEVLSGSLHSSKAGAASVNDYLKDHFSGTDLKQAFSDWSVAVLVNDCSLGEKYCYKNQNLKKVKLVPFNNFMPFSGESTINLGQTLTEWSCHWQKFTGGKDGLKIDFKSADPAAYFKVRYIVEDNTGKLSLNTLALDKNQQGQLVIPDFSKQNRSITIIPCLERKTPANGVDEKDYTYYLSAATLNKTAPADQEAGGNATSTGQGDSGASTQIDFPFALDKPIGQMSRQELLITIIRLILYLRGINA
jgi:hypothetical protein